MRIGDRHEILRRLWAFTSAACNDPIFRRKLRYTPRLALAQFEMGWDGDLPAELPIRHYEISVDFKEAMLFGSAQLKQQSFAKWPRSIESKLLMIGAKPLALEHGREPEMAALADCLSAQGLTALLSPYEFTPSVDENKSGYSNLGTNRSPALPNSGNWRSLISGKEPVRVQLAWLCLLFGWDEFLGQLLGYPNCCATAFARLWPEALNSHQGEICDVMLHRSASPWVGRFGWETNIFGRYLGIEAIQHFPCDWGCPISGRLARRNRDVLDVFWPSDAAQFQKLSAPVLYTGDSGVFLFPGAHVVDDQGRVEMKFEPSSMLATQPDGNIAKYLRQNGGISCRNQKYVLIGEQPVSGWLIDFSGKTDEHSSVPATKKEGLYEILLLSEPRSG